MAQPTNTFDSYDAVGAREDLADKIYNVDPFETPFFTATSRTKATNHLHEWQTDTLRASADNAHIQGDDTIASAKTATTRLGNYTQTLKDAVAIPDTDTTTDKAGRQREIIYQEMKMGKELRLDLERALFASQARVAGTATVAARMAGAPAWIATSTSVGGGSPADPTGDGTDTRTDGTQTAFTQARMDTVLQSVWENGGKPNSVYLSAFQMDVALGFTGMNNQRSTIEAKRSGNAVINAFDVYVTPWGTVEFKPSRENRGRDIFVMQDDMWAVAVKRAFKKSELAKTGDATKIQIVGEYTLCCKNEKASGIVADNSTS